MLILNFYANTAYIAMVEDRLPDRDGKTNEFVFGVGTRSGIMPTQTDNYATSKLYFKCKGIENFPISCVQRTIINPCQITLILHLFPNPIATLPRGPIENNPPARKFRINGPVMKKKTISQQRQQHPKLEVGPKGTIRSGQEAD